MRQNSLTVVALALHCGIDSALQENRSELAARQATYTSAFLSDIRGKLNGSVFSKARGGIGTIRGLVTPRNPRSTQQLTVRAALTLLSGYWSATLTSGQRAAWNALATDTKSGFDQFVASNTLQLQAGNAVEPVAPASMNLPWLSIPDETDLAVSFETPDWTISMNSIGTVYLTAGQKFLFYIQRRIQRAGVASPSSNLVFVGTVTSAGTAPSLVVPASIRDQLGTAESGDEIYLKVRGVKDSGEFTLDITARIPIDVV